MGIYFTDRYSLLHFATGIVAYYWDISFAMWFMVHAIFEYIENTSPGMRLIRKIKLWPGGKERADNMRNRAGDQFYGALGWIFAYFLLLS
jgi:hypothetical protein